MDHEHDEQAARTERGEDREAGFIRDHNQVRDLKLEDAKLDDIAGGPVGPKGGGGRT